MWHAKANLVRFFAIGLAVAIALSGCSTANLTALAPISSLIGQGGIVIADEPHAVLAATEILNSGGNAADAAVTLAFALAVTYQSAAGIGGGGICLVYDSTSSAASVLHFNPQPATARKSSSILEVAIPALPRGLFALHSKSGKKPWQSLVIPAEKLARFGFPVSKAFAATLAYHSSQLINDPIGLGSFSSKRRVLLGEGQLYKQLDLSLVLGRLRSRSAREFYSGSLAEEVVRSAQESGTSLGLPDLRAYAPRWTDSQTIEVSNFDIYAAYHEMDIKLIANILNGEKQAELDTRSSSPSSTGFIVADRSANVVACTLTMLEPFGTGTLLSNYGFLLAPSPSRATVKSPPLLSVIATMGDPKRLIFAAATGGYGAPARMALLFRKAVLNSEPLAQSYPENDFTISEKDPAAHIPSVNVFLCRKGLPSNLFGCSVSSDPNSFGYSLVTNGGF